MYQLGPAQPSKGKTLLPDRIIQNAKPAVPRLWLNGLFTSIVNSLLKGVVLGVLLIASIAGAVYGSYLFVYHAVAPDIEQFINSEVPESSKLYAGDGTFLYEIYKDTKRTSIPLAEVSPNFKKAILAAEDHSFYEHPGVSVAAIARSALQNLLTPNQLSGGSTITQQLVKNVILTPERSIYRKLAEAMWAEELEKNLTKDEILERYINYIYFGRNSAGVEAASLSYFGKSSRNLTLAEAATLAAVPKAPTLLSPDGPNTDYLKERKEYILETLLENRQINRADFTEAKDATVAFASQSSTVRYPFFSLWVKHELIKQYGEDMVYNGGLKVQTTLDPNLQDLAESTVKDYIDKNSSKLRAYNAGLVAIDPKTGEVKVMVGSKDYYGTPLPEGCKPGKNCRFDPNTNIPTSPRQTGSSFKPYVYLTAFGEEFKYTPATIVSDVAKNFSAPGFPAYRPQNYTLAQYGKVPVRKALAGSLNIAAVSTLANIGSESVIQTLRNLGVTSPMNNCGLSLALGACEMTLLEHTGGFAGIANLGKFNSITGVSSITNSKGKLLFQTVPETRQAVNAQAAYMLADVMSDNDARSYIFGKNNPLRFDDRKVAVKTGTTQNWKDGWTVGFTPQIAVGVWVGNSDGTLMRAGADSIVTAAPLWRSYMDKILADMPAQNFEEPEGIARLAINPRTGKVLTSNPRGAKFELFASYSIPYDQFGLPSKPTAKVAGASKPDLDKRLENSGENTVILDPWQGKLVLNTPFQVSVHTGTSSEATTVDLYLDGKLLETKAEPPFLFNVEEKLSNGKHTLKATANHFDFFESSDTISFQTFFNPPPVEPRGVK